jgi:thioredoxin reductase/ferredoxin
VTLVVPAILGGLALAVMALVAIANARRPRSQRHRRGAAAQVRILIHSINDDRCTGCDACVAVCPTNVLDLVDNKSRVLRFQDCIQCEACMWACPTTALVMHPEGTEPPKLRQPELDQFYQTAVPGQYLIGEVAGKPLVKNAANLGRGVVEHMIATGLRPSNQAEQGIFDVAIVGSGPGGMSAALTCIHRGLSYVLIEKDSLVASTVARYPKGKLIMAEPYDVVNLSFLPVFDSSKEEMVPLWTDLIQRIGVNIRMNETVETVKRGGDGLFDVRTNVSSVRAHRVVLGTGLRGKPRTLGVPGENQAKVASLLEDPDNHRGQTVCVVGGGDSALEAAIALADAGAKVVMTYRGRSFARAQPKNKQTIESYEAQRRIKIKYQSEVVEFTADSVTLKMQDGTQKRYPNEAAFILIGADPPIEWLNTLGVHFVERPHMASLPKSDDLVRQLVPDAAQCPDNAAAAVALVKGMPVSQELAQRPVVIESRSKRLLRAASNIFHTQSPGGNKLERPMPLSEFAKQARRHSGQGRRDKLDPRERTRVLRMLRDEGGRRADDDSKLYLIERAERMAREARQAEELRRAEGSPPPAAPPRMPQPYPREPAAHPSHYGNGYGANGNGYGYDPMGPPTGAAPGGARPQVLGHPPATRSGDSPKPAVIVGLARASQSAPNVRRRRDDIAHPLEPTRQMAGEDARRMLERMEMERREREAYEAHEAERRMRESSQARLMRGEPMVPRDPRLPHGPGRNPYDDPRAGFGVEAPLHLDEEDTRNLTQEQARSLVREAQRGAPAGRRHPRDAFEEPTRAIDWGNMDDVARGSPPGGRKPPTPPGGVPRGAGKPVVRSEHERPTVEDRVVSLSEIDWDLD